MMLHRGVPVIQALHSVLQDQVLVMAGSFHLLNPFYPEHLAEPDSAQTVHHGMKSVLKQEYGAPGLNACFQLLKVHLYVFEVSKLC